MQTVDVDRSGGLSYEELAAWLQRGQSGADSQSPVAIVNAGGAADGGASRPPRRESLRDGSGGVGAVGAKLSRLVRLDSSSSEEEEEGEGEEEPQVGGALPSRPSS
jgi:hypothetical protein